MGEDHRRPLCDRVKSWNGLMLGVLLIESVASWVIFWPMLGRDWTMAFPPLLATAGTTICWMGYRKIYGQQPSVAG